MKGVGAEAHGLAMLTPFIEKKASNHGGGKRLRQKSHLDPVV